MECSLIGCKKKFAFSYKNKNKWCSIQPQSNLNFLSGSLSRYGELRKLLDNCILD